MTEPVAHHNGGQETHTASDRPYFPAEEWDQFQQDDIATGRAIVLLMTSIFALGLFIYTLVALAARAA